MPGTLDAVGATLWRACVVSAGHRAHACGRQAGRPAGRLDTQANAICVQAFALVRARIDVGWARAAPYRRHAPRLLAKE